jgi:hypothetical protein
MTAERARYSSFIDAFRARSSAGGSSGTGREAADDRANEGLLSERPRLKAAGPETTQKLTFSAPIPGASSGPAVIAPNVVRQHSASISQKRSVVGLLPHGLVKADCCRTDQG